MISGLLITIALAAMLNTLRVAVALGIWFERLGEKTAKSPSQVMTNRMFGWHILLSSLTALIAAFFGGYYL